MRVSLCLFRMVQSLIRWSVFWGPIWQAHVGSSVILNLCNYDPNFPCAVTTVKRLGSFAVFWQVCLLPSGSKFLLRHLYFYCPIHFATSVVLNILVHWSLHFGDIYRRLFLGCCHRPPPSPAGRQVRSPSYYRAPSPTRNGQSNRHLVIFLSPPWWVQPNYGSILG